MISTYAFFNVSDRPIIARNYIISKLFTYNDNYVEPNTKAVRGLQVIIWGGKNS